MRVMHAYLVTDMLAETLARFFFFFFFFFVVKAGPGQICFLKKKTH